MKDFFDLAGLLIFIYELKMLLLDSNIIHLWIITFIAIIYVIKYLRMKYQIENNTKITRKNLARQKEFFIDFLSHDIKNLVIAQLRGSEILLNKILGDINETQRDIIIQSKESCAQILNMISMYSRVHTIEQNTKKLIYEKFNITELIISCFKEIAGECKEKSITISFTAEKEGIYIEADKKEIKNVLLNLFYNAIIYSNEGGQINVELVSQNDNINVVLSGMKLFVGGSNEFENNRYTTIGYTLGMYLCKRIIEAHNGKLFISEKNKNSISFTIPKYADNIVNAQLA